MNKRVIKRIAIMLFVLSVLGATVLAQKNEQRKSFGDANQKEKIQVKTSAIFKLGGDWLFALTRRDLLGLNTLEGTELEGAYSEGHFIRIIGMALAEKGKYTVEYYFEKDALLLAYETFEYYSEAAPVGAWRNSKRLAAWERRSYFHGVRIGFAETRGKNAPNAGTGARTLINTSNRLLGALKKHQNAQKSSR